MYGHETQVPALPPPPQRSRQIGAPLGADGLPDDRGALDAWARHDVNGRGREAAGKLSALRAADRQAAEQQRYFEAQQQAAAAQVPYGYAAPVMPGYGYPQAPVYPAAPVAQPVQVPGQWPGFVAPGRPAESTLEQQYAAGRARARERHGWTRTDQRGAMGS